MWFQLAIMYSEEGLQKSPIPHSSEIALGMLMFVVVVMFEVKSFAKIDNLCSALWLGWRIHSESVVVNPIIWNACLRYGHKPVSSIYIVMLMPWTFFVCDKSLKPIPWVITKSDNFASVKLLLSPVTAIEGCSRSGRLYEFEIFLDCLGLHFLKACNIYK